MALHDPEEKKRRGYTCKHSVVYMDGREWLSGVDWKRRKAQLETRAGGRCERITGFIDDSPIRCYGQGIEPHHRVKRSRLHDDRLENLVLLCGFHHQQEHPEKNKLHWSKK